jgi:high affinity Mn2+ porin
LIMALVTVWKPLYVILAIGVACVAASPAAARGDGTAVVSASPTPLSSASPNAPWERFSIHAQSTDTQQYHGAFPAATSGTQSLGAAADTAKTVAATLYLGVRLWKGGEYYLSPEIDQGFGLGQPSPRGTPYFGTIGVAGFVSGEAYKVGRDSSYGRIERNFLRQTFNLGGGDPQKIDPGIDQLAGSVDPRHLVVTAGKFAVTDIFDNNTYAHDPSNDFLNWTIIDMGSFDYAADAFGYTYGASAELTSGQSTLRAGLFQLTHQPNSIAIESVPFLQYSQMVEFEQRTSFFGGHPGAIKALVYADDGYMGSYADAIAAAVGTGGPPNTAAVRQDRHVKPGGGLNIAQEIAPDIGAFARLSAMNGTYETYDFTDVDRSISGGLSINGYLYHRPGDSFGVGGALNALSRPAIQYFADGGLGLLIGDGSLSYGGERILETYYRAAFTKYFGLTFDYQRIVNPGYNTVRGPVSVFGLRYHVQM